MTIQEEHKEAISKSEFETERHSSIYDYDIDVASQSCAEITKKHMISLLVSCGYEATRDQATHIVEAYLKFLPK